MGESYRQLVDQETLYALNSVAAMNEDVYEKIEEVESKVDKSLSTWNSLNENPGFDDLDEQTKTLIWELAKIRENDSPKSKTVLAEQYDVSESYISQLEPRLEEFL